MRYREGAVVIFSWEREMLRLKQTKRTTATTTTKRKRNLGWAALKRQTEECLFCVLIICKCLMRASSCSFEFKRLTSWNLKSVTEGFPCWDRWWDTVLKICLYQSPEMFCFSWRTYKCWAAAAWGQEQLAGVTREFLPEFSSSFWGK